MAGGRLFFHIPHLVQGVTNCRMRKNGDMRGNMPPSAISDVVMKHFAISLILCFFSTLGSAQTQVSSAPIFAAMLNDLDDNPAALVRFRGKPLLVNFWARWCPPCRAEIPELIRFSQAHKGEIEVIGIGIEDNAALTKAFAREYGMSYPVFVAKDKGFPLLQALGNPRGGLPYTLFIDRNGRVIQTKLGLITKADLDAALPLMLKK